MILILSQLCACIYITDPMHRDKPTSEIVPPTTPVPSLTVHNVEFGLDRIWLDLEIRDSDSDLDTVEVVFEYADTIQITGATEGQDPDGMGSGWFELTQPTGCGFTIEIQIHAEDPDGNTGDTSVTAVLPVVEIGREMGTPPFAACGEVTPLSPETSAAWTGVVGSNVFHLQQDSGCRASIFDQDEIFNYDFGEQPDPAVQLIGVSDGDCRIAVLHR